MEKKEDKSCYMYASIRKKHFENILLLNVLPMHHQSVSDHALDSVVYL